MREHECIYALLESRRVTTAQMFLDRYLPTRKHAAVEEFEFPQLAVSPDAVFSNSNDLLARLEADPEQPYSIYWDPVSRSRNERISQGMLMYTKDAALIVGLAVRPDMIGEMLLDVATTMDSRFALVFGEDHPPITQDEFKALCRSATPPRIANGIFTEGIDEGQPPGATGGLPHQ